VKRRRFHVARTKLMFAVLFAAVCLSPPVEQMASYPSDLEMPVNQKANLPIYLTANSKAISSNDYVVSAMPFIHHHHRELAVVAGQAGEAVVRTKLFGFLPWKSVRVKVVPPEYVYAGGQSVGIRLFTKGAMVVGYDRRDLNVSPAGKAHIQVGDIIERIDGHTVVTAEDVRTWTNRSGESMKLTVRRGQDRKILAVTPAKDHSGTRHLGLFVRDKTAGVGTLTFYDASHHLFGALGHVITDADTGMRIQGTGDLFSAQITGVVKGAPGQPGEKKGNFATQNGQIGSIKANSDYGVFGSMDHDPMHSYFHTPIPVALPGQVHVGRAKILTVLHGQQIEEFLIEIEDLARQENPNTKSMVIKVTDERLLKTTGGIVQGMSGSPIIQDGKLVGAVTHVFVSDPTRGYGVYAEWMLHEALHSQPEATIDTVEEHSVPALSNSSE
jgi:stage IV sporulation protein B